ncbi:glycosyltransferase [Dyella acidiphila]|uniref:Glycosyltransferase n=1 Tax=Dyella acidiphila TaxID=2775866 RepID=A0ABR9G8S3_9GAMM|nr:glycosyltransferase [Dyella acidiphila]
MTEVVSVIVPMYRDWAGASRVAAALCEQQLPSDAQLEIVVVDDGSKDSPPQALCAMEQVQLIRLPENVGRSGARNTGAAAAKGRYLLFIDSDCLPLRGDFLSLHLQALRDGAIASTGHVTGIGHGFWNRYQQLASRRRQTQHRHANPWVGSSQNMAVLRTAFEHVGGFDLQYRHYGFEDRDLLIRLSELGTVTWVEAASVSHQDDLQLPMVALKMARAAQASATLFALRHPDAYRILGYASLDTRLHPWLRLPARLIGPLVAPSARILNHWLERLPFWLSSKLVKTITACAYLYGSTVKDPHHGDRQSPL